MGILNNLKSKKVEVSPARDYARSFRAENGTVTIALFDRSCLSGYDRFEGTATEARAFRDALTAVIEEAVRLEGAVASIYAK